MQDVLQINLKTPNVCLDKHSRFGHTDEWTDGRANGWTERHGSWNSYLDVDPKMVAHAQTQSKLTLHELLTEKR